MTREQVGVLLNLVESVTCDTCHYQRVGLCAGRDDGSKLPCHEAYDLLAGQQIDHEQE